MIKNIHEYDKEYSKITYHILSAYPDIDMDKLKKIALYIDLDNINLTLGERIIIYNRLNQPFIKEQKEINLLEHLFLKKINTMIYTFMPHDIDTEIVEKQIEMIEDKTKDLRYEERWMIHNKSGHIFFKKFISESY